MHRVNVNLHHEGCPVHGVQKSAHPCWFKLSVRLRWNILQMRMPMVNARMQVPMTTVDT